jgi:DNA polymerase II small subunit/DNA polymerase delta subunit B
MFRMERTEIIKKFLTKGVQIAGSALDFFASNPEKADTFLSKQLDCPSTITLEFINEVLKTPQTSVAQNIKPYKERERASVSDIVDFFNKRYDFFGNVLSKRLDLINLISINKVSDKIKKFSIIGMVKEKNTINKTVVVEDKTGEIELALSEAMLNQLVEDETVGIVCRKDDIMCGEKLIFPDIPLQREINKTKEEKYIFLISDIHMDSEQFKQKSYEKLIDWLEKQQNKLNIFVVGDISSKKEDIAKFLSDLPNTHEIHIIKGDIDGDIDRDTLPNPAFVQIENVKLFLFHDKSLNEYMSLWGAPEQTLINLIKKRHLAPAFSLDSKIYDNDPYLLDTIPDIIVAAHSHIPSVINYKGITAVTTGSFVSQPIFWLMNLRTRETFKIDFS